MMEGIALGILFELAMIVFALLLVAHQIRKLGE